MEAQTAGSHLPRVGFLGAWVFRPLLGLWVLSCLASVAPGATLTEQLAKVSTAIETQPEAEITTLLQAGIDENQPAKALAPTREWLRQNLPTKPKLLELAARAAERSGDWSGAAALYRQYLEKIDPKSPEAGEAITSVYRLLLADLNDDAGAYAFSRNEAARLAVNPRFRQFDRWFLEAAKARSDSASFTTRLLATFKSGASNDLLLTYHEHDIHWLLGAIRAVRYDIIRDRFTPEFVTNVKALAAAISFDEELKLKLDWAVSVKAYNMAKIDGKDAKPPVAEANALLKRSPGHAAQVQTDWAGGLTGPHYRDNPKKYWPHELEAKLAPIREALPKLSPLQQADLLHTWSAGYYDSGPHVLTVEEARAFLTANPQLINSKSGPALDLGWESLTIADAKKFAPLLALNPAPVASLIRAFAASGDGKDYDKAMAALLGEEAWRLGPQQLAGTYADQLWHKCGRPGTNTKRDQEIARSKTFSNEIPAIEVSRNDPADKRLESFRQLWSDFRSPTPKIPGVVGRLAKVLKVTPEAVPELLKDPSPEAQSLVRNAIAADIEGPAGPLSGSPNVLGINPNIYDPVLARVLGPHRGNVPEAVRTMVSKPHPLEPMLRQALAAQLAANKVEPWLALTWINAQFSEPTAESLQLLETLTKSPAWAPLPEEVRYAARAGFRAKAMNAAQIAQLEAGDPSRICKTLNYLPKDADAAATADALSKMLALLQQAPVRISVQGLDRLALISETVFADPKVTEQIIKLTDIGYWMAVPPAVDARLLAQASKNPLLLQRTAASLWRSVESQANSLPKMLTLAESLVDEQPSAAATLATCGLATIERYRTGHRWFNPESDVPRLKAVRGKASIKLGLITIPVAPDAPSYRVYQSQAAWLSGNEDTAWGLADSNWQNFMTVHRELEVPYVMWVLGRVIQNRDEPRQEALIKSLLGWTAKPDCPLNATERANVEIAYGDIALQRGQLREARELYTRTRQNKAYKDLPVRHQATLRQARAERLAKDFDGALRTLAELEMEREPAVWGQGRFARAEVFYDREDYDSAGDDVDSVLAREPDHADAKLLLGKVQLKRKKLMEASELELGASNSRKSLVPGEKLKVTLTDPTLAVSGVGSAIEVVVKANSGDSETFSLRQFGDQKTKFRGEVATALGAPVPGDGILQVLGDDEVYYAYSERFRKQMNNIDEMRGGPIRIASDAVLAASARKLLSEDEQRFADMQEMMAELKGKQTAGNVAEIARAKIAARSLDATARSNNKDNKDAEGTGHRSVASVAKPGNPIHIRVTDPDRSRTPKIDEVTVSVSTSSGDSIGRVTLRETGTHTGRFEGSVPTASAQALAFASNSEPGRNPNMVISALTTYPAWKPVAKSGTTPTFTVDLNDNVPLGELKLTASEPGAKLQKFAIQTGMSAADMTTVGVYPYNLTAINSPWQPSVTVVNDNDNFHASGGRSVHDLSKIAAHMEREWMTQQFAQGIAQNVAGPSAAMPASIPSAIKWKRNGQHDVSSVIYRFRGYFFETTEVARHFRVDLGQFEIPKNTHPSVNHPPQFLLAVDGVPITTPDGKLDGTATLQPGLHRLEIWGTGWVNNLGFGRSVKLLTNLEKDEKLVDCPDTFFDPAKFPAGTLDHRNGPVKLTASADGTAFTATFAKDSQARLIRLLLLEQEGPVPAINKLALTKADGTKVLPVAQDFAALNKNDILEMIAGDKITVRYVDDRPITENKDKHERFLSVAFTDAKVEFADIEPRISGDGDSKKYHETLLRFAHNAPLSLVIADADMDASGAPDKVKVSLTSEAGGTQQFEAVETGDSTGIFKLVITPVPGKAGPKQMQVAVGGTITASYRDAENNRPGVPIERIANISHAAYSTPTIQLAHAQVTAIDPKQLPAAQVLHNGFERLHQDGRATSNAVHEHVQPRWQISSSLLPSTAAPQGGFNAVHGRPLAVEVIAPHLALGMASTISVFAQTESGRSRAPKVEKTDKAAPGPRFNINVPGTIELEAALPSARDRAEITRDTPQLATYQSQSTYAHEAVLPTDRFRVSVPLIAGVIPPMGIISATERKELARNDIAALREIRTDALVVSPGDTVHFGVRFLDAAGAEQWITASTKVITHPVFEILSDDYRSPVTSAFVGETLNLRVVDLGGDTSDKVDTVSVLVQAKSNAKRLVELRETGNHTGIFKGGCTLTYAAPAPAPGAKPAKPAAATPADAGDSDAPLESLSGGVQVVYGDVIAARYTAANGLKSDTVMVSVSKGADGGIRPFSKIYQDPEIAIRSQFSQAEAYLELAKRHRLLKQTEAAALEYNNAKQLLASAMDQFTDPETRAHAEYLLGTLTFEEADATTDNAVKESRYRAALARFMNVTGSYPDTLHASKAQYRIALVYEALKEPDIAAQEYVKLAYKYPDSEFIATAMARLGSYFLKTATAHDEEAKPLLASDPADKDAQFKGQALKKLAASEFIKTAHIFGRLQKRFPDHELAGQAGIRAGQAYVRATRHQDGLTVFLALAAKESYDGPSIRAQAMYWAGMCYQELRQPMAAYSIFKRLTYDFPETQWAAFARGQLSQDSMLKLETGLELKRLESEK